jgi:hypothetical protein
MQLQYTKDHTDFLLYIERQVSETACISQHHGWPLCQYRHPFNLHSFKPTCALAQPPALQFINCLRAEPAETFRWTYDPNIFISDSRRKMRLTERSRDTPSGFKQTTARLHRIIIQLHGNGSYHRQAVPLEGHSVNVSANVGTTILPARTFTVFSSSKSFSLDFSVGFVDSERLAVRPTRLRSQIR